jgi:nucleoside-diphosphate-sugar epimerase
VNVVATLNVLEAAKALKAERVVFASSAAVYGTPRAFPISEAASISPISPHGVSKAASELYLGSFEANHGIETVSLRYFNVYGPRQTPSQYVGVISKFTRRALQQKPLEIYGNGSQTPDFIFVSDVVDATVAALEKKLRDRVFNIASGTETTILEFGEDDSENCRVTIRAQTLSTTNRGYCSKHRRHDEGPERNGINSQNTTPHGPVCHDTMASRNRPSKTRRPTHSH